MKKYKVSVYEKLNKGLEKSWRELWQKSLHSNFFNSPDFFKVCVQTHKNKKYQIFSLEENGKVTAILPLHKEKVFSVSAFVNPGGRFLEKSPLLVRDIKKDTIKILIDFILEKGNLHLSELPREFAEKLRDLYPESLLSIISLSPYLNLEQCKNFGMNKKNFRKITNRISKNKNYLKHLHIKNNLYKSLGKVFSLEKKSHKQTKGKDIFSEDFSRLFFRNLIRICKKNVRIDFLTLKNKTFVSAIGLISGDRYYAYHTCYLRDYKYFIPGKMITIYMMDKLKKEGIKVFDFCRGLSNFKEDFSGNFAIGYDFYLSQKRTVNCWWKLINYLRRLRIVFIKTEYSKDYQYLFKNL